MLLSDGIQGKFKNHIIDRRKKIFENKLLNDPPPKKNIITIIINKVLKYLKVYQFFTINRILTA